MLGIPCLHPASGFVCMKKLTQNRASAVAAIAAIAAVAHGARTSAAALLAGLTLALTLTTGPVLAADIAFADLPKEGKTTHALILKGGPYPYPKDGTVFGNFENNLPKQKRGYYKEFTVPTPGAKNRGARRIVCGAESREWGKNAPAACWYTADHYKTFQNIKAAS